MGSSEAAAIVDGTELVLVRHGRTEWNAAGRIQGSGDSPLTSDGVGAAKALGWRLARSGRRQPTACYASPLGRAHRTAELICAQLSEPLVVLAEHALRERSYGCLEGLTYAEQIAQHPEVHARNRSGELEYAPPGGGESRAEVALRALDALTAIARRHPGERVLVVTHSGLLGIIARRIIGLSAPARSGTLRMPNAAVNLLRWRDGGWQIALWGDDGEFSPTLQEGEWLIDSTVALKLVMRVAAFGAATGLAGFAIGRLRQR